MLVEMALFSSLETKLYGDKVAVISEGRIVLELAQDGRASKNKFGFKLLLLMSLDQSLLPKVPRCPV